MNTLKKNFQKLQFSMRNNRNLIAAILVGGGLLSATALVISAPSVGGAQRSAVTCRTTRTTKINGNSNPPVTAGTVYPKRNAGITAGPYTAPASPLEPPCAITDKYELEDGIPIFHYNVTTDITSSITVDTSDICVVNDPDNPTNVYGYKINGTYAMSDWKTLVNQNVNSPTDTSSPYDQVKLLGTAQNYDANCTTPQGNETYTKYASANNAADGYSGSRVYFYLSADMNVAGSNYIFNNNPDNANNSLGDVDADGTIENTGTAEPNYGDDFDWDQNGIRDGNPGDFRIYGNPEDLSDSTEDQTIKWSGNTKANLFVYALDASCGVNGDGQIFGAAWCKIWNESNSNVASVTVPTNLIANLGADFSQAGLLDLSSSDSKSWQREEVPNN